MTESPPALTPLPQFDPTYWRKVERLINSATIERVTNLPIGDDGEAWVEIVIGNNMAFRRKKSEVNQFLHANQKVLVENIGGRICTGLLVPDVGWAWRMTAEDLANHSRELAAQQYEHARQVRASVLDFVTMAIMQNLEKQGGTRIGGEEGVEFDAGSVAIYGPVNVQELAAVALMAMEHIGRQAQAV